MSIQFWIDPKNPKDRQIDPELFSTMAEELAKKINVERTAKINNPTQIRKFFDEVIRFQGMIQSNPEQFAELLPYIKMLNAKAAYAAGRDLIGVEFKLFLSDSLKQVNNREDFEIFCTFFEAFIGFYKYYAEKEKAVGSGHPYQSNSQRNDRNSPQVFRR